MKKVSRNAPKFENRVRFNWGYHDAAQAVRQGWATPENNFGFARSGSEFASPADVLRKHFDSTYAQGWQLGYNDAVNGTYVGDSETAWQAAVKIGLVRE